MALEDIKREIDDANWRATEYLSPHEYVVSQEYPEVYAAMKEYLLHHGYTGRFLGVEYVYANIRDYRYWVVANILNRARIDTPGVTEIHGQA